MKKRRIPHGMRRSLPKATEAYPTLSSQEFNRSASTLSGLALYEMSLYIQKEDLIPFYWDVDLLEIERRFQFRI